ncbi:MAG: transglutaminase family protein [Chloroflexi bacterium]|nr:transglutaminase family protein [Chloroflexota bacterium]MDA1003493.1 transglutaminase family protein [Chloroflexota bacterium]
MLISLDYHSAYRYDTPVRLLNMELHMVPMSTDTQELVSHTLSVDPSGPINEHVRDDPFGNSVQRVDLLGPVDRVAISLRAEVRTTGELAQEPVLTPLLRALALSETPRARFSDGVAALAAEVGDATNAVEYAGRLQRVITGRYEFVVGHSEVSDTADHLLESGRGVCQDFVHLMLGALRMRGIPALYVSGFLAPIDGASVSDAGHAWVRIYSDGAWFGFDPANSRAESDHYIVTALGRDYDDVAPVRGSFRGIAEESWSATIQVQSMSSAAQ